MTNLICYCSTPTVACIWCIDFLPSTLFGVSCRCNMSLSNCSLWKALSWMPSQPPSHCTQWSILAGDSPGQSGGKMHQNHPCTNCQEQHGHQARKTCPQKQKKISTKRHISKWFPKWMKQLGTCLSLRLNKQIQEPPMMNIARCWPSPSQYTVA